MSEEKAKKMPRIVAENGATMIALDGLGREGDRIVIQGRMMGSMPSKMYMSPEDALKIGTMVFKNFAIVSYVFLLPFILLKRRRGGAA